MKLGEDARRQLGMAAVVGAAGIELAVLVGLGAWAGQWLDSRIASAPLGMIGGIVVGAGVGFYALFYTLQLSRQKK